MKNGSNSWSPNLKAEALSLVEKISNYSQDRFESALDVEAFLRAQSFQAGVKAYHDHPYVRDVKDPEAIWSEGGSNLLDYGGPEDGPVLLAIPSLINKAYVLDLNEKRSFMRSMSKKGIRSFMLDWGDVGELEKEMSLSDYILGRLSRALDEVHHLTGHPISVLGYCMGGVLTTALAALRPEKISSLILLATPWDFHAGHATHTRVISASRLQLENIIDSVGLLPVDVIQALFAAIDPFQIPQKFAKFGQMKQKSKGAEKFVALEDWLNDGVPLSGTLAKECLFDWYIENAPCKGNWELDGVRVNPKDIKCPTLVFVPQNDRIVPPESACALGSLIPNARMKNIPAGHIGMVTGRKAIGSLYTPLSKWLLSQQK